MVAVAFCTLVYWSEGCPARTRPDELGIGRAIAACVAGGAWVGDPSCDGTPPWEKWGPMERGYQPAGRPNMANGKSLINGGLVYFGSLHMYCNYKGTSPYEWLKTFFSDKVGPSIYESDLFQPSPVNYAMGNKPFDIIWRVLYQLFLAKLGMLCGYGFSTLYPYPQFPLSFPTRCLV